MARRRVRNHRDLRLRHLGEQAEVLFDAIVRRGAETARRDAVVIGNVRVEAAIQQLLHEIYASIANTIADRFVRLSPRCGEPSSPGRCAEAWPPCSKRI